MNLKENYNLVVYIVFKLRSVWVIELLVINFGRSNF